MRRSSELFVSLRAGGAVTLENAGQARIRGAEFDTTYVPFPMLNPGFVISANMGYLDAIYTDYRDGAGYDEKTGLFSNNIDFTGRSEEHTSELQSLMRNSYAVLCLKKKKQEQECKNTNTCQKFPTQQNYS